MSEDIELITERETKSGYYIHAANESPPPPYPAVTTTTQSAIGNIPVIDITASYSNKSKEEQDDEDYEDLQLDWNCTQVML